MEEEGGLGLRKEWGWGGIAWSCGDGVLGLYGLLFPVQLGLCCYGREHDRSGKCVPQVALYDR